MTTGLSPPSNADDNDDGISSANSGGRKSSLRISSSLQDLMSYDRRLDLEEGSDGGGGGKVGLLQRENVGSSFSKQKAAPGRIPFLRRKWPQALVIMLCIVLGGFLAYLIAVSVHAYWFQGGSKYYIVLDCGSTGTRAFVYKASVDHNKDGILPISLESLTEGLSHKSGGRAYDRMETEPGLHMLVRNTSGLKAAIKPLVRWAEKQIPKHAHKSTSLFLYGTAGVRRLPSADSKWLLNKAWLILHDSPFLCRKEWIKIISGVEEAYFGWIALNYKNGVLGAIPKRETFGALDMGGSSLQVTFEGQKHGGNETFLNLRIGEVNHYLTAYSLAGYGLNDAFDKSVVHLLKRIPSSDLAGEQLKIKHPCLQAGYKAKYTCSQCTSNQHGSVSPRIGGRKLGNVVNSGLTVQLIGAPNWEECSALAKTVVNLSEWSDQSPGTDCDLQPCALPDGLPRPNGQFYAMSGFFVVYRFFKLSSEAVLDDVLDKGREFCEKTWEQAEQSVLPQPFIEQYCFRAPYIVFLLRQGLHVTDKQVIVGSGSITWTIGVALLEAGNAFSTRLRFHNYEIFQVKIHPLVLIVILFVSFIFLLYALSCVGNLMPRFLRRLYLPLFRSKSASAASVLSISSPFRFQRWSPISTGDGRVKMPLSPTVSASHHGPFGFGHGLGGSGIQLMESSLYSSTSSVLQSYSSANLGQMFDSTSSFWSPHRSQMQLQSRRSQSREDLITSLAETHIVKV